MKESTRVKHIICDTSNDVTDLGASLLPSLGDGKEDRERAIASHNNVAADANTVVDKLGQHLCLTQYRANDARPCQIAHSSASADSARDDVQQPNHSLYDSVWEATTYTGAARWHVQYELALFCQQAPRQT